MTGRRSTPRFDWSFAIGAEMVLPLGQTLSDFASLLRRQIVPGTLLSLGLLERMRLLGSCPVKRQHDRSPFDVFSARGNQAEPSMAQNRQDRFA